MVQAVRWKMHGILLLSVHYFKRGLLTLMLLLFLIHCLHPSRFAQSYPYIDEDDILNELESSPLALRLAKENSMPLCHWNINDLSKSLQYPSKLQCNKGAALSSKLGIEPGGSWKPTHCISRFHIAIIIPFRNRSSQLHMFLSYMHPFLQSQLLNYHIFVIEQSAKGAFNRAKLLNIGYVEAMKISPFHCFIFHDVDLIPQKLNNIYACTHLPRHMSSSLNTFRYNLPYQELFGGAVAILQQQFKLVNGFSNTFFGWGGEDDDFHNRLHSKGLKICRFAPSIARYVMIPHAKESPNENRYVILKSGRERFNIDGLNTLRYKTRNITYHHLYTWVLVDV